MVFIGSLLCCLGVFFAGKRLFQHTSFPPQINSLRLGRVHYLLMGIVIGMALPSNEALFRQIDILRTEFLSVGLVWFGFQTGLGLDLQRFRRLTFQALFAQLTSIFITVGFAILGVMASGAILYTHLGLKTDRPLAVLLIASFVASIRFPEPTFRWHQKATPHTPEAVPDIPLGNLIALFILGIGTPLFSHTFATPPDELSLLGLSRNLALLILVGLVGGIALDFVLRAHRQISRGVGLAFGVVVIFGGLCQTFQLPALIVGLIIGIWLVNSTVAKRDVMQFSSRASGVIEPIFFIFLGSLIGGHGGNPFFELRPLFPLALLLIVFRSMGRTIGLSVTQYLFLYPKTWREIIDLSFRPLSTLSVAIAVQGLFLLQLTHNTLVAGFILAVIVTQAVIFSPPPQIKQTPLAQTGTS